MGMVHNWKHTRYRRRSSRVYLTVRGAMRRLNTPLAQCIACDNVTSHGEFCYKHWCEIVAKAHEPGYVVLTLPNYSISAPAPTSATGNDRKARSA